MVKKWFCNYLVLNVCPVWDLDGSWRRSGGGLLLKYFFRFFGEILEILKRFMVMAERKRQESC